MGQVRVTLKVMPESLDASLEDIKSQIESTITKNQGKIVDIKEEPIAFGLKALVFAFLRDEKLDVEPLEHELQSILGVGSVEILEINRAL
jgi:elongation factor 1-beta